MILNVHIEKKTYSIEVPDSMIVEAEDFFARLDRDMDRGWQMSREWVDHPEPTQRCQIVADRILTALHQGNQQLATLLCAYILARVPGVEAVRIDTGGEIQQTELAYGAG